MKIFAVCLIISAGIIDRRKNFLLVIYCCDKSPPTVHTILSSLQTVLPGPPQYKTTAILANFTDTSHIYSLFSYYIGVTAILAIGTEKFLKFDMHCFKTLSK
jgi:hypothetical protein